MGWEFSSTGRIQATAGSSKKLNIRVGLMPDFKTDIKPGETFVVPTAFVGCYQGDIDAGSRRLQQFIQDKLLPKWPDAFQKFGLTLNEYLDAGADKAKEADVLRCLQFGKDLGLEVFMPDAMWFPACGDWRWDPARFPNGVKPIEQAIHKSGMKFGLWCAWNNGGISDDPGALSVRGPYGHPDWFGENLLPDWKPGPFYGVSADMGDPEAKSWAINKTQKIVGDWKVDMLKTDVNPMINDCVRTDHRHPIHHRHQLLVCSGCVRGLGQPTQEISRYRVGKLFWSIAHQGFRRTAAVRLHGDHGYAFQPARPLRNLRFDLCVAALSTSHLHLPKWLRAARGRPWPLHLAKRDDDGMER